MKNTSIVAAVDGSAHAGNAARLAAELADATGGSLKLLHVSQYMDFSAAMAGMVDPVDVQKINEEDAHAAFDSALERIGERRPVPEKIRLKGDPANKIIEYMETHPGTHVVMGKCGHSKIERLLLGSVSDKVVRHGRGLVTVVGGD